MATNISGEKVGSIFAEIGVKFDKLESDFKKVESLGKKTAEKVEYDFKQLKLDIDSRLANMKLSEVKRYYQSLKIQMEQKLKFNADATSIEKTAVAMDSVRNRIKQLSKEGEETGNKLGATFRNLAGWIVSAFTLREVSRFTIAAIKANTELADLRNEFRGSTRDIELMKKATANMVDDSDLLKLSNQASELGIKIEEQPRLFLLASNAAKKFGGDAVNGISVIIRATEGQSRALGKLGIERAKYNQEVERLSRLEGGKLNELDAEVQKRVKIQAVLNSSKVTMEDVIKHQATMNQQIKALPALWNETKESFGSMFTSVLSRIPLISKALKDLARNFKEVSQGRTGNAVETITYDFRGTNAKDREDLVSQWEIDIVNVRSKINKLTADFRNYKMDFETYDKTKLNLEIQISTYDKLIELAKKYKEEIEDSAGSGLSAETIAERARKLEEETAKFAQEQLRQDQRLQQLKEDNIAKYYEEVKFQDENYFEWKADQILREISTEEIKNEKLKKLIDDRYEYERDKMTDPSLRGKTPEDIFNEITTGTIVRNPREQMKQALEYSKQLHDDMLNTASEFGNALESAFGRGGDKFVNIANSALQAALKILDILDKINAGGKSPESGALGIIGTIISLFAAKGIMKMAGGGSFIVPPGFPNDSYPMLVQSGERVTVTPAHQTHNYGMDTSGIIKALSRVENRIGAMNRNLIRKEFHANIFNPIDGTVLVKEMTAPSQNSLRKAGVNLEEL